MRYTKWVFLGFVALNAENMLVNSSFEEWDEAGLPVGWTVETNAQVERESLTVYHGSYSLKIITLATTNAGVYQDVNITPGQTYILSGYVWGYDIGNQGVGLGISWYTSAYQFISFSGPAYDSTPQTWEYREVIAQAPANAAIARVRARGYRDANVAGFADYLYFDVFTGVKEVPYLKRELDVNLIQKGRGVYSLNLKLDKSSKVHAKILSVDGRVYAEPIKAQYLESGEHNFTLNLTSLRSGVYILYLVIGDRVKTLTLPFN